MPLPRLGLFYRLCLSAGLACGAAASGRDVWMKISTPYQTIFTDGPVSDAKEWAACLEVFHQDLQTLAATDDRMLDRMTMLNFRKRKAFRSVAIPGENDSGTTYTSCRFNWARGQFVGALNGEEDAAIRQSMFLESTLWLTSAYHRPLPLWLVTGLQSIYSEYSVHGNTMEIGGEMEASAQSFGGGLHLPIDEMLAMTTRSAAYVAKDGKFNAQAWAFVHFLMFGDKGANRPLLAAYMQALQRGDDSAVALALLAPKGMPDLNSRLRKYVTVGFYRFEPVAINLGEVRARVRVAPATDYELNLALAYTTMAMQTHFAAMPYVDRVTQLQPESAETYELLAEMANARNDEAERDRCYAEAVKAGSTFYLARYYAILPAVQALAGSEAAMDGTDADDARTAFDKIKVLIRSRPGFKSAHEMLALLAAALHSVNPDDGELLREGEKLFPNAPLMVAGEAAYEIVGKNYVAGKAVLDRLKAGEWDRDIRAPGYVRKIALRMESANDFAWLKQFYASGDFANANKMLGKPRGLRYLLSEERAKLAEIRTSIGVKELLASARSAVAARDWPTARTLVRQVEEFDFPELRDDCAKLVAEISAGENTAAKSGN